MNIKEELIEYAHTLGNIELDKPFGKFPKYEVLRHANNGKWFGLLMPVEKNKLGLSSTDSVEVIDVKANPEIISILKSNPGYLSAYHMNKNNWITLLLDGTIEKNEIMGLLKDSYDLTK